jgi:Tfp pilus assembly protein PilO
MCSLQFLIEYELLQPLSAKLDDLGKESVAKQRHTSDSVRVVPKTQLQMDAILLRLPNSSLTNDRLVWLHQQADVQGVLLRKVNYRDIVLPGLVVRKEISVDFSGTYPSVRKYLRSVLAKEETISVEALELNRVADGSDGDVRGQLRLAFFSRRSSP